MSRSLDLLGGAVAIVAREGRNLFEDRGVVELKLTIFMVDEKWKKLWVYVVKRKKLKFILEKKA